MIQLQCGTLLEVIKIMTMFPGKGNLGKGNFGPRHRAQYHSRQLTTDITPRRRLCTAVMQCVQTESSILFCGGFLDPFCYLRNDETVNFVQSKKT